MHTDKILHLWHSNVELIIGALFILIFVLLAVYLLLGFLREKDAAVPGRKSSGASANTDLDKIEATLKRLLEKAEVPGRGEAASPQDIEKLKELVDEKDSIIRKLEVSIRDSGGKEPAGDSKELKDKISDLEARLSEYEIIEDDIADLSMYKDENNKLKGELERLKKLQVSSVAALPAKEAVEESTEELQPEPLIEEDKGKTIDELELEAIPEEEVTDLAMTGVEALVGAEEDDDIMAEFAKAVAEQRSLGSIPPPVDKGAAPEEVVAASAEQAEDSGEIVSVSAAQSVSDESASSGLEELGLGDTDTDRMLGEIEDLNASADFGGDIEENLKEGADTDRMLAEMDDLNADAAQDSEQKELVKDFEKFVGDA